MKMTQKTHPGRPREIRWFPREQSEGQPRMYQSFTSKLCSKPDPTKTTFTSTTCTASFSWYQSEPWLYPLNMGRCHSTSDPIVNPIISFTLACWLWLCHLLEYAASINNILLKIYYLSFRVSGIVLLRLGLVTLMRGSWYFDCQGYNLVWFMIHTGRPKRN